MKVNSFSILECVLKAHHLPFVRPLLHKLMDYHMPTYIHCLHTAILATQVATEAGFSEERLAGVASGALLHDIGKLEIPVAILDKKEPLTDAELDCIRTHPLASYNIVVSQDIAHAHVIDEICLKHHVYLNQKRGYPSAQLMPEGIDPKFIPDEARIVTVSDIFGAIVSPRPYHSCLTNLFALSQLYQGVANGELDLRFVKIMDSLVTENRLILSTSGDNFYKRSFITN